MSPCPPGRCELKIEVTQGGRFPSLTLETWFGAAITLGLDDLLPVTGGHLATIDLAGARLADLDLGQRHQLLRFCRHLLRPGGKLRLPVGSRHDQYPRVELEQAAAEHQRRARLSFDRVLRRHPGLAPTLRCVTIDCTQAGPRNRKPPGCAGSRPGSGSPPVPPCWPIPGAKSSGRPSSAS